MGARAEVIALLTSGFQAVADELGLADAHLAYEAEPPTVANFGYIFTGAVPQDGGDKCSGHGCGEYVAITCQR